MASEITLGCLTLNLSGVPFPIRPVLSYLFCPRIQTLRDRTQPHNGPYIRQIHDCVSKQARRVVLYCKDFVVWLERLPGECPLNY